MECIPGRWPSWALDHVGGHNGHVHMTAVIDRPEHLDDLGDWLIDRAPPLTNPLANAETGFGPSFFGPSPSLQTRNQNPLRRSVFLLLRSREVSAVLGAWPLAAALARLRAQALRCLARAWSRFGY